MIYSQDWNVMTYLQKFKDKPQQTNQNNNNKRKQHQPNKKNLKKLVTGTRHFLFENDGL